VTDIQAYFAAVTDGDETPIEMNAADATRLNAVLTLSAALITARLVGWVVLEADDVEIIRRGFEVTR
jgi:hypothetical protein